ncbi:G_PROTEIN_RECEP_F1_2 domain-containing protein [Caenorhabditis elegans]|uniref:G_PROTEIN_RECEP_F1_2 domain-containing protein n=1 Tax=Caenorhabditis elegans TaxID=6239 RepID=Q17889_CAEEL|nr:G_PROTEIN_RECEP_F1_2 domain-containing protein [Caenorhabditis elegans]CCD62397.1 G_PROTEIN_RECEP_F1_2 domain-containing protein [Caenorhabditis elegans]|eukprot:NP_509250.1 Uncharacterized protein CELE_C10A4.5 [Caenorhabditis elegans]
MSEQYRYFLLICSSFSFSINLTAITFCYNMYQPHVYPSDFDCPAYPTFFQGILKISELKLTILLYLSIIVWLTIASMILVTLTFLKKFCTSTAANYNMIVMFLNFVFNVAIMRNFLKHGTGINDAIVYYLNKQSHVCLNVPEWLEHNMEITVFLVVAFGMNLPFLYGIVDNSVRLFYRYAINKRNHRLMHIEPIVDDIIRYRRRVQSEPNIPLVVNEEVELPPSYTEAIAMIEQAPVQESNEASIESRDPIHSRNNRSSNTNENNDGNTNDQTDYENKETDNERSGNETTSNLSANQMRIIVSEAVQNAMAHLIAVSDRAQTSSLYQSVVVNEIELQNTSSSQSETQEYDKEDKDVEESSDEENDHDN